MPSMSTISRILDVRKAFWHPFRTENIVHWIWDRDVFHPCTYFHPSGAVPKKQSKKKQLNKLRRTHPAIEGSNLGFRLQQSPEEEEKPTSPDRLSCKIQGKRCMLLCHKLLMSFISIFFPLCFDRCRAFQNLSHCFVELLFLGWWLL